MMWLSIAFVAFAFIIYLRMQAIQDRLNVVEKEHRLVLAGTPAKDIVVQGSMKSSDSTSIDPLMVFAVLAMIGGALYLFMRRDEVDQGIYNQVRFV